MIIIINGSINAGKSTVAKLLAEKISHTVDLEIDVLRDYIRKVPLEDAIPINLENAALLSINFVRHGFNVVIPYPLSQDNYDFLTGKFAEVKDQKIYTFTLNPNKEVAMQNRGERKLTDQERNRIEYHYQIGINSPSFGIQIDNSNQSPEETVTQILKLMGM